MHRVEDIIAIYKKDGNFDADQLRAKLFMLKQSINILNTLEYLKKSYTCTS